MPITITQLQLQELLHIVINYNYRITITVIVIDPCLVMVCSIEHIADVSIRCTRPVHTLTTLLAIACIMHYTAVTSRLQQFP